MTKRTKLSLGDIVVLMRHFVEVAALKGNPPAQRQLLIDGLNQIIGTNQSFFYVADGWGPQNAPRFTHQTITRDHDAVFLRYLTEFGVKFPLEFDPFCAVSIHDRTALRSWTFDDVLPDAATCRRFEPFVDVRRDGRVSDGVVSLFRHGPRGERVVGVGMHQFGSASKIDQRQRAMVEFAVAEIRRLVELGHLALPPQIPQSLPPRLLQVLDRLLAGKTPKQIARELRLSLWTVREHMQRLYSRYKVSGRDELMSKFVLPANKGLFNGAHAAPESRPVQAH